MVLEDIADPGGVIAEQLQRIARLDVLRQHEDGDTRMSTPDDMRGLEAFRCVGGRHPDVDDDHAGRPRSTVVEEIDVARSPDHPEPSRDQSRGEGLAQKGGIVCKDDPRTWMRPVGHGSGNAALTRVPSPTPDVTSSVPPAASTRSASPRRPVPLRGLRRLAVVGNGDDEAAVLDPTVDADLARTRVAIGIRERLGDDVVRRGLDRRREASVGDGRRPGSPSALRGSRRRPRAQPR